MSQESTVTVQENLLNGGPAVWGERVFPVPDSPATCADFEGKWPCDTSTLWKASKDVAKLCVFSGTKPDANRFLLAEGTAIRLSHNLLITTKHTIPQEEIHCIYVNFRSQPVIPRKGIMETGGWIPVEPYGGTQLRTLVDECDLCGHSRDFLFLKPRGCSDDQVQFPKSNEFKVSQAPDMLIGFLSATNCHCIEDFWDTLGKEVISYEQSKHFFKKAQVRRMNRKLIFLKNQDLQINNESTCSGPLHQCTGHILTLNCLSGAGTSGGMVGSIMKKNDNTVKIQLCAMHLGRRPSDQKIVGLIIHILL